MQYEFRFFMKVQTYFRFSYFCVIVLFFTLQGLSAYRYHWAVCAGRNL